MVLRVAACSVSPDTIVTEKHLEAGAFSYCLKFNDFDGTFIKSEKCLTKEWLKMNGLTIRSNSNDGKDCISVGFAQTERTASTGWD